MVAPAWSSAGLAGKRKGLRPVVPSQFSDEYNNTSVRTNSTNCSSSFIQCVILAKMILVARSQAVTYSSIVCLWSGQADRYRRADPLQAGNGSMEPPRPSCAGRAICSKVICSTTSNIAGSTLACTQQRALLTQYTNFRSGSAPVLNSAAQGANHKTSKNGIKFSELSR